MAATPPKIAAFVTTYDRPGILAVTLERLLEQTRPPERVLVVDNGGAAATAATVDRFAAAGVTLHRLEGNRGPAGGAAAGLRRLTEEGWEWIYWGDDDDPPWSADLFARLLALAVAEGQQGRGLPGAVAATGVRWNWRTGRPARLADGELHGAVEVDAVAGSGQLLLHRPAVLATGWPDDRLFWGLEDYEYCLRLRRAGFRLLADGDLMLERRRAAGRLDHRPPASPVPAMPRPRLPRDYYTTRNYVFLMRTTFQRPDLARRELLRTLLRTVGSVARGPRFAAAFVGWQARALWDGYRGRMGRTVALEGTKPAAGGRP